MFGARLRTDPGNSEHSPPSDGGRAVGERALSRPLTHQKPFPDRAAKSHVDVVRMLFCHLFEPAFTHPPEEGDDQHLLKTPRSPTLLITAFGDLPVAAFGRADALHLPGFSEFCELHLYGPGALAQCFGHLGYGDLWLPPDHVED